MVPHPIERSPGEADVDPLRSDEDLSRFVDACSAAAPFPSAVAQLRGRRVFDARVDLEHLPRGRAVPHRTRDVRRWTQHPGTHRAGCAGDALRPTTAQYALSALCCRINWECLCVPSLADFSLPF